MSTYWTPVPSSGATPAKYLFIRQDFQDIIVCCFQFPDEIENTKSLREKVDGVMRDIIKMNVQHRMKGVILMIRKVKKRMKI